MGAAFLVLCSCADWPATGPATEGPWPELVPLSSLDLAAGAAPEAGGLMEEAAGLEARAQSLRGRGAATRRGSGLSARAVVLRGPAETEEERRAMRERLAGLAS